MQIKGSFFTTQDGMNIRYHIWPPASGPSRGTVVYVSGRAEFLEKNRETIDRLHKRGFAVYAFDWRGQGLSSRMLKNRHKGYVGTFAHYMEDLDRFADRIVPLDTASPKILLAHSMGGNIGLRYLHDNPGFFDRAVMVSPMIDINMFPLPRAVFRKLVRKAAGGKMAKRYIPGAGNWSAPRRFCCNSLTSDPVRFWDETREIRKNPLLALGGVTFGWAAAALDSIDRIAAPGYVEAIEPPVLLVSGTRDRVVDRRAHRKTCSRLPCCRFLEIAGARHEILKETDAYQHVFWQAFDRFAGC